MTSRSYKTQKMAKTEALKLAKEILQGGGRVSFSKHALERLEERNLQASDCVNVLLSTDSRVVIEGEANEHGVYGYRIETNAMVVIVRFSDNGDAMRIISIFRR